MNEGPPLKSRPALCIDASDWSKKTFGQRSGEGGHRSKNMG
jgi:hypothetical protein